MSILSALRQHDGSIDDLAKLPQAMIMQMAQKKQISEDMIAPILSRKAEMTEAVARTKAMQNAGAAQPTIMEQLMQRNAMAEQPPMTDGRDMGVAQLPIPERQYAGGGIVAFADGGMNDFSFAEGSETDKRILDYLKGLPKSVIEKFKELNQPYGKTFAGTPAELQNILSGKTPRKMPENIDSQYEEQGKNAYVSAPLRAEPGIKSLAPAASTTAPKATATKPQSPLQKATDAPVMPESKVDPIDALIAKYEKMISGNADDKAKALREARNARMLEAGLNIMGGTSSNFAQNVALASPAARGYGEDVKGIRAEETAKLNQLAGLGLKGAALKQEAEKLGITKKHYDNWFKAQQMQIGETGATRRDAANLRAETAMDNRVATVFGKLITQPKYMDNPELAYADAQKLVTGKAAQPTFTGFSGRSLSSK